MKNLIPLLFMLISFSSQAAIIDWGGSVGDWDVAANWVGGVIPTASDEVYINGGRASIPKGYSAFAQYVKIGPFAEMLVRKKGTLTIRGNFRGNKGLLNNGKIYNYGSIYIDDTVLDALKNSQSTALFINKYGATLHIGQISGGITGITNFGTAIFKNHGNIIIENSDYYCILNSYDGSFINTGTITLDAIGSDGIYNVNSIFKNTPLGLITIKNSSNGIKNIDSEFENKGKITIDNIIGSALNNEDEGLFLNTETGIIDIENTAIGMEGILNTSNSTFDNSGVITIQDATGISLSNDSNASFTNNSCATIHFYGSFSNISSFINDGFMSQDYNGANTTDINFINNSIIEDIQGSFDPSQFTNNGFLIPPITSTVHFNVLVLNPFLGPGTGLSLTTNYFYTDNTLSTSAGTVGAPLTTWLPNADAISKAVFYVEMDNGNGCPVIVEIHVDAPVLPRAQQEGGATIKAAGIPKVISKINATTFSTFPNPSKGNLYLKADITNDRPTTITLLNINGQIVFQKAFDQLNTKTSILEGNSNFAPGIYFLMVKQNGEIIGQEKVVFY